MRKMINKPGVKILILSASCVFFSSAFWMQNTVDYWSWSLIEICGIILFLYLLITRRILLIPSRKFFIPLLLLLFWACCSVLWTANFHATLTAIYKLIFILIMTVVFLNDPELWKKIIKITVITVSALLSAAILFFPNFMSNADRTSPNLLTGFAAIGGILSLSIYLDSENGWKKKTALFISILILLSILSATSAGGFLCWLSGTISLIFLKKNKRTHVLKILIFLSIPFLLIPLKKGSLSILQRKFIETTRLERVQIWKDCYQYASHHLFLGTGLGTFRDYYPEFKNIESKKNAPYAHNEIIHLICETGLIGFAILAWLGILIFRAFRKNSLIDSAWIAIAIALFVHSFFDFNLRYPPIIIVFIFTYSLVMPVRETEFPLPSRILFLILIFLFGILFLLPGIASLIFKIAYPDPIKRRNAALMLQRIDPMNAVYHFESGRLKDLAIAIELEPRNVWFRRTVAQFFYKNWKENREIENLKTALAQYETMIKLAPNVTQFHIETEQIRSELSQNLTHPVKRNRFQK